MKEENEAKTKLDEEGEKIELWNIINNVNKFKIEFFKILIVNII